MNLGSNMPMHGLGLDGELGSLELFEGDSLLVSSESGQLCYETPMGRNDESDANLVGQRLPLTFADQTGGVFACKNRGRCAVEVTYPSNDAATAAWMTLMGQKTGSLATCEQPSSPASVEESALNLPYLNPTPLQRSPRAPFQRTPPPN